MIRVAAITGGINDPSSRYRIRQYIKMLNDKGILVDEYYSKSGKYPPLNKSKRLLWVIKCAYERIKQVIKINNKNYDCVIIQREMISTLKTFENFIRSAKILDVDYAIYIINGGKFIRSIAMNCDAIICGNQYLANEFQKWNKKVCIIPTGVDIKKFIPSHDIDKKDKKIIIGWIGTSGGFKYIYKIEEAIRNILDKHDNVEFVIVSDSKPLFTLIKNYKYIKWSADSEVENFQRIDIGLMPLEDDEWARGKCSFKMLQYMACGSAVVVSSVGMNEEVLRKGKIGFGTKDYYSDWFKSIDYLINNEIERKKMGIVGRNVVQEDYSIDVLSDKIANIIKESIMQKKR